MIEPEHGQISIHRQCQLLDLARSSFYYEPASESQDNLQLMSLIDEQYTRRPFYGYGGPQNQDKNLATLKVDFAPFILVG